MDSSRLFDPLFGSEAMGALFSDSAHVQALLDFEAALARAEASVGVIPSTAGPAIAASCHVEYIDLGALAQAARGAGNLAIPLVKQLTERVMEQASAAAPYVHWGATSQDVIDSGLMLQLRSAVGVLETTLARLRAALVALVQRHRRTVMAGRTFLQHAVPTTLGLKAAGWLGAVERDLARLQTLRPRVLCLQFGGAAGNLSALREHGLAVAEALARELGLGLPELPWHGQRDRIAELGSTLAITIGSLGKLARDISLLMQSELAEAREPSTPGRAGSSTMPHKQNPLGCTVALAAATRAPGLVSTLLTALLQEHERGVGGWHAEWQTLPTLCCLAGGAAEAMVSVVEGLEVDAQRMRENLTATRGAIYAEAVAMALAPELGKAAAHRLLERCTRTAHERGQELLVVLSTEQEVRALLDDAELAALFDPERSLGSNDALIERALAAQARR